MIVGNYFEGDPTPLAWQQHDVYREALTIIVGSVQAHLRRAEEMLCSPNSHLAAESRDHRTLQMAHDILAAAWRFQTEPADMFADKPDQSMFAWLAWLGAECDSWHRAPDIVQLFLTIFENQNTDIGYAAEDELTRVLIRRFNNVPWQARYQGL